MLLNNKLCVDAGTVNCPCYLAEYGKCIVCSRLGESVTNGDETSSKYGAEDNYNRKYVSCDCQWHGVCIYNEYLQNNQCIKLPNEGCSGSSYVDRTESSAELRHSILCEIQQIKWFEEDLAVMRISVPRGMAQKAALPGSFVFVKAPGAESYFDFPVSVLYADYEGSTIELAVKINGPKSMALMKQCRNYPADKSAMNDVKRDGLAHESSINDTESDVPYGWIELRGIYRNGLLGVSKLLSPEPKKVLCMTKGVGLAPVANYICWAGGRDHIDVIVDLEKINCEFAEYALSGNGLDSRNYVAELTCMKGIHSIDYGPLPLNMSWEEGEKYDVIIISASEYYQQNIYVPEAKKVLSNNYSMCCGEGICGACICMNKAGAAHRMCKECRAVK